MQPIMDNLDSLKRDFYLGYCSRYFSEIGRQEVWQGKAKFGIFGDGKELPLLAMSHFMKPGDWHSGYYRDQTLMLALGVVTLEQLFAQLYGEPSVEREPSSGGRQMVNHFGTRFWEKGIWKNQKDTFNIASGLSSMAGQIPRLLGLAQASVYYERIPLESKKSFFSRGREIAWGTVGNGATSEGMFWETVNAAGVLQVPMVLVILDDGYAISVSNELQTCHGSISKALSGFQGTMDIYSVDGRKYFDLCHVFEKAEKKARTEFHPQIIHIMNLTQPLGHSTSGSHEKYKDEDRLNWEVQADGLLQLERDLLDKGVSTEEVFLQKEQAKKDVELAKKSAFSHHQKKFEIWEKRMSAQTAESEDGKFWYDFFDTSSHAETKKLLEKEKNSLRKSYNTHLFPPSFSCSHEEPPVYKESATLEEVDGRVLIRDYFKNLLKKDSRILILGQDVGKLGGVNLEFEGLQDRFGKHRVMDSGVRETTLVGQGIGLAMRGLRPVVDIQYLDYLIYALPTLSDDLACLHYRSCGGQVAPVILRTKGHRLEGIWHSGSPMSMILGSLRGIYVGVPRNMTQAIGLYSSLLKSDIPGLIIEVLNAYRKKELLPSNLNSMEIPWGNCEVLKKGHDITVVTYGACTEIVLNASKILEEKWDVHVEVIDVRTLYPFDISKQISHSLYKTSCVLFCDEDVPGGATAYMMQKVLEEQNGFDWIDIPPKTLTAREHRPAYGTLGDRLSKPQVGDVISSILALMHERCPRTFPRQFP